MHSYFLLPHPLTITRKRTAPHIQPDGLHLRPDIKIKDIHRQRQRGARIGDVHDARDMPLHGRAAQQEVDLVVVVAVAAEVLDGAEAGLAVRDGRVEVVLFSLLVDREALEGEVAAGSELGFHGARVEERGFEAHLGHAVLQDSEFERDDPRHLDGAAEGDLPVPLREVQVADGEFGARNVHGEVDFGAAREVLDVAVAAVFGAALRIIPSLAS